MKVISVVNRKGGVGKTTAAMHIAQGLQRQGKKVAILDSDPQQSCKAWESLYKKKSEDDKPPLPAIASIKLSDLSQSTISSLEGNYDIAVIDTPGVTDDALSIPLKLSDLIIMPLSTAALDVVGTIAVAKVVLPYMRQKGSGNARLLLSRTRSNTRSYKEAIEQFKSQNLPFFEAKLSMREAYMTAVKEGVTVFNLPRTTPARKEVSELVTEIMELLNA